MRVESTETRECSEVGLAWAAAICEESGQDFAGYTSVPRSYYDIKGRPDEDAWYGATDKELTKLFDMGTFEIAKASCTKRYQDHGHSFLIQEKGG